MCRKTIYLMTLVVLLGLGLTSVANAYVPDMGWWKLDEGSGTTAVDLSVNGNDGTLVNDPQWAAGKTGFELDGALDLDGTNDYVNCGQDTSLNSATITVAAWVKTNDSGNSQHNVYVSKGDHGYVLKHRPANDVALNVYVNGGWRVASYPVDSSFNGVWHHLAGTYDGTNVKLYVDGTLRATTPYTGSINNTAYNLNIGRDSEITSRLYDGLIDDVRIYSWALAQPDIQAIVDGAAYASNPSPADTATDVSTTATLSWTSGDGADSHDVYFGTTSPGTFVGNQAGTTFNPSMQASTTYYWRVDEVDADDVVIATGDVWSYTTAAYEAPLTVYSGTSQSGTSMPIEEQDIYYEDDLGNMNNAISSFKLLEGYELVIADANNGDGPSKSYVAYDKDIVMDVPSSLNDKISFIRVVPWIYGEKKGTAGDIEGVDASWFYLWGNSGESDLPEREYVPMSWGGGEAQPNKIPGFVAREEVANWLGFNEPDYCDAQSGQWWDLCTVSTAVGYFENLMGIGVRLGSPAVHEGSWNGWLNNFINQANAADVRVDFIAYHWYDWGSQPSQNPNPTPAAVFERLKNRLNELHQKYKRPIWLTEWNANKYRSRSIQNGFLQLAMPYMDKLGYVERYSYFQPSTGTGDFFDAQGQLTTTGTIYKEHVSPANFAQSFPEGWASQDIGAVGVSGKTYYANDIFTVCGSGANIWGTADEFQYAYVTLNGDGQIIAKVDSMITVHHTASKAAVMIRNTLDANSAHAMMDITSSSGAQFQYRATAGGTMVGTTDAGFAAPYWVKVVRSGNSFSGYRSPDGTTWTQVGSTVTISMNTDVYMGLAVTAQNDAKLCDVIFTDIEVTSGTIPPINLYTLDGDALDSVGTNDGTVSGATFVTGHIGQAARFDGVDDHIDISRSIQDNWTIAFWVKTTQTAGTGQWWAGKGLVDGEVGGVQNDFGTSLVGSKFAFGVGNPDTTILSSSDINTGSWVHVAATRNAATGEMKVYVGGTPENSGTGPTGTKNAPSYLTMGSLQTLVTGRFLAGDMDDVRIYDTILDDTEIATLAGM